jgi:GT2 family glycosyltransferase
MMLEPVDVTAVIVNYNTRDLLHPCIDALRAGSSGVRLQIVIIDNGSRDGSQDVLRAEFADCELVFNVENVGFGRANNQALPLSRGRHLLLLNTDAFVAPGSVALTVGYLDTHPDCGLLGVRLVGREGDLQPSCRYFPTPWNEFVSRTGLLRFFPRTRMIDDMAWDHASPRNCDWVPGCYYLVRRSVVDQVGLFDPRFFLYYEEVDHCRMVKTAGWQVTYYPHTTVVHIGGESAKSDAELTSGGRQISALQIESGLLFFRKHHGLAGLWLTLALVTIGDVLLALKWMARHRTLLGARSFFDHAVTTWSLAKRTAWAKRPTR